MAESLDVGIDSRKKINLLFYGDWYNSFDLSHSEYFMSPKILLNKIVFCIILRNKFSQASEIKFYIEYRFLGFTRLFFFACGERDELNLNYQIIYDILTKNLGVPEICGKSVPKNFIQEQKHYPPPKKEKDLTSKNTQDKPPLFSWSEFLSRLLVIKITTQFYGRYLVIEHATGVDTNRLHAVLGVNFQQYFQKNNLIDSE